MFTLQKLTSDLTKVNRNHHILDSDKAENDVEHSYAVTLLCWYIYDKLGLSLDLGKILKYAMVHDFVEVYAGDVNTFANDTDRKKKLDNEAIALTRLTEELKSFEGMTTSLKAYEAKSDEESVFVWTVDKMQALILADLDTWRPYKKISITYESFASKHHEQLSNCSFHCKEIFSELLEYCKTTYYDQPADKSVRSKILK